MYMCVYIEIEIDGEREMYIYIYIYVRMYRMLDLKSLFENLVVVYTRDSVRSFVRLFIYLFIYFLIHSRGIYELRIPTQASRILPTVVL